MIHITLGPARAASPEIDGLGRTRVGYAADMTPAELYEANRGCWVFGARADREQYALVSFERTVRQAIEIDRIVDTRSPTRRAIEGRVLEAGHPVHDMYVGKPSPIPVVRNPVTYFDASVGRRLCRCGCGAEVSLGSFIPGHDQRALHERVAKIGSVAEFLDWFDATQGQTLTVDGHCFCGCGEPVPPGTTWKSGHDATTLYGVIKEQAGSVAAYLQALGYTAADPRFAKYRR